MDHFTFLTLFDHFLRNGQIHVRIPKLFWPKSRIPGFGYPVDSGLKVVW